MSASPPVDDPAALVLRGWEHLRLQRPLAAWASWQMALRVDPDHRAAAEALEVLAAAEELPVVARLSHRFRSPKDDAGRALWNATFAGRDLRDLDVAAGAFAELAEGEPPDPAALHNLGLCLAWEGRNAEAIAALDASVKAGAAGDRAGAVESWMLAEVLRQGAGAEVLADDWSHALTIPWDPETDGDPIASLAAIATVRAVPAPPIPASAPAPYLEVRTAQWLDAPIPSSRRQSSASDSAPRILATVIALPDSVRFSGPDPEVIGFVEATLREALGDRSADRTSSPLPIRLMDADAWLSRFEDPDSSAEIEAPTRAEARRAAVEFFYENLWINRPRTALADADGVPLSPVEAARLARSGGEVASAKLAAVVAVREQLSLRPHLADLYQGYPFDRLRRRLGLEVRDLGAIDEGEIASMSEAELEALDPATLADLDVPEAEFASRAVSRPEVHARFVAEANRRRKQPEDASS